MKEVKPVLKFDGVIGPDDRPAIEIYTNSDVDVKVKTNIVSDENGDPLSDQVVVDIGMTYFERHSTHSAIMSPSSSDPDPEKMDRRFVCLPTDRQSELVYKLPA